MHFSTLLRKYRYTEFRLVYRYFHLNSVTVCLTSENKISNFTGCEVCRRDALVFIKILKIPVRIASGDLCINHGFSFSATIRICSSVGVQSKSISTMRSS